MSLPVWALVARYTAARAVERTAEDLRKAIQRALAEVIRSHMDAEYEREHGRAPDPLSWRTDRIEVASERELLVVTGQFLYGDEWEVRVRTVEIPIKEFTLAQTGEHGAEQGSEPPAAMPVPDRDADVLDLIRGELQAMHNRLTEVPDVPDA